MRALDADWAPFNAQVLVIPANLTDSQLRQALEPHQSSYQLLHFASSEGAFGKFEKQEDDAAMQASS